jgi:hypothetical protein
MSRRSRVVVVIRMREFFMVGSSLRGLRCQSFTLLLRMKRTFSLLCPLQHRQRPGSRLGRVSRLVRVSLLSPSLTAVFFLTIRIVYIQVHSKKDTFVVEVMDYQHMTKDRSLGVTDLAVSDLLAEGPDKKNKPWVSTGKQVLKAPLKTDGKSSIKGSIEYEVEFCMSRRRCCHLRECRAHLSRVVVPCAHLKNVSFHEPTPDVIAEDDESSLEGSVNPGVNGSGPGSTEKPAVKEDNPDEGITIPRAELIKTR